MATVAETQRTCSYCYKRFPTLGDFSSHWKQCPIRIKFGYIENPNPTPSERWRKIKQLGE